MSYEAWIVVCYVCFVLGVLGEHRWGQRALRREIAEWKEAAVEWQAIARKQRVAMDRTEATTQEILQVVTQRAIGPRPPSLRS